jgi:predicted transposase YdaD
MPILNDIMDHEVLGPKLREARAEGAREGREEGRQEGREEEGRLILSQLLKKRFGRLPVWAAKRLAAMAPADIEKAALQLLDAASLEELLGR